MEKLEESAKEFISSVLDDSMNSLELNIAHTSKQISARLLELFSKTIHSDKDLTDVDLLSSLERILKLAAQADILGDKVIARSNKQ